MGEDAMNAAKTLASGDAKLVLAAAVIVLLGVAGWLGKMLYSELKNCAAQLLDAFTKKIEADHKLADAIDGQTKVMEATLAELRVRKA